MIRRVVEYMVECDAKRILGSECPFGWTAYGSPTQADALNAALENGYRQVSKRLLLCRDCAKKYDKQKGEYL